MKIYIDSPYSDEATEAFLIKIKRQFHSIDDIPTSITSNREHGWYQKFNKQSKRKNFKGK